MPDAGVLAHLRVVTCLLLIMACGARCLAFCLRLPTADWSGILLLSFECFVLLLEGSQTLIKYGADVWQAVHGAWTSHAWFVYHVEFATDVLVQCATLAHYSHILLIHGISFLDALLLLDMRLVLGNLRARLAHYRHYRAVTRHVASVLQDADKEQLLACADDVCAICRDALNTGVKKLPCAHLFHGTCLLGWLEQNSTCPTCRRPLFASQPSSAPTTPAPAPRSPPSQQLWSFGPLGRMSPMISVSGIAARNEEADEEEAAVASVLTMLPQYSAEVIRADLRRTRSVALTVERALDGRLPIA